MNGSNESVTPGWMTEEWLRSDSTAWGWDQVAAMAREILRLRTEVATLTAEKAKILEHSDHDAEELMEMGVEAMDAATAAAEWKAETIACVRAAGGSVSDDASREFLIGHARGQVDGKIKRLTAELAERDRHIGRLKDEAALFNTRIADMAKQRDVLHGSVEELRAELAERTRERDDATQRAADRLYWHDLARDMTSERDAARAEVERLQTWPGIMESLNKHWPESVFPTKGDDPSRDDGPRIVSLLRRLDAAIRDRNEFAAAQVVKFAEDYCTQPVSKPMLSVDHFAMIRAAELRKAAPAEACGGCGATSPKDAETKCRPDGDSCPRVDLWHKAAPAAPDTRRLHGKFIVERSDGSSAPGGKHHGCEYFVLDMTHDPHAVAAVAAYADSCRDTKPELAADLVARWCRAAPAAAGNVAQNEATCAKDAPESGKSIDRARFAASLQKLSDWIGDHWCRKDWGIEGEKLCEVMNLVEELVEPLGFKINGAAVVDDAAPAAAPASVRGSIGPELWRMEDGKITYPPATPPADLHQAPAGDPVEFGAEADREIAKLRNDLECSDHNLDVCLDELDAERSKVADLLARLAAAEKAKAELQHAIGVLRRMRNDMGMCVFGEDANLVEKILSGGAS